MPNMLVCVCVHACVHVFVCWILFVYTSVTISTVSRGLPLLISEFHVCVCVQLKYLRTHIGACST